MTQESTSKSWIVLVQCIALCLAVELSAGWLTSFSVNTWYPTLVKPSWTPPSWIFGPVWTLLYISMGVSLWLIWRKNQSVENNNLVPYIFFGVQLFLNFLWSGLFFGLRSPELALIDIMALWFAIGGTVVSFWQVDKFAALLLIPYWAWVTFAAVLNAAIRVLN